MLNRIKNYIWTQFDKAVDTIENALEFCPFSICNVTNSFSDFWYLAQRVISLFDIYLTESPKNFIPFTKFGVPRFEKKIGIPDKVFSKEVSKSYVGHCGTKCKQTIENKKGTKASKKLKLSLIEMAFLEFVFHNVYHVQHHTAQLKFMLRRQANSAHRWVKNSKLNIC